MNNKQVSHLWANKSRPSAKGSHFYFEGETIFSYGSHFPIARHFKGVVLFTSKSYSSSTARHISYARMAATHLKCFTVADVRSNPCGADVKQYAEQIERGLIAVARSRGDCSWKIERLENLISEANEFCTLFKFKTRFSMPENLDAIKAKGKEQSAKKAAATLARNIRIAKEQAKLLAQWLNGESVSLPYNLDKVYLRSIPRSKPDAIAGYLMEMQTSKGATVPLSEAEKAFRFVMLKRATGWHRNGETFSVGEFHLDAVNESGIVAGCHRITWDEIERFANSQGWNKTV